MSYLSWLHHTLLAFFPADFRRKYRSEIQDLLEENLAQSRRAGQRGWLIATGALCDAMRHLWIEHRRSLRRRLSLRLACRAPRRRHPFKEQKSMHSFWQDLRYGIRGLSKRPAFTLAAVLTLAIGIGANSSIFTLINGALLRPLLIKNPEELVACFSKDTQRPDAYRAFSYPNYRDLRQDSDAFANLAAHNLAMVGLTEGEATRRIFTDIVSSNYFSTLGVPLFMGREFSLEEESPGSAIRVVIASHSLWQDMGADPGFVGSTLQVNGQPFTVIGITPAGFSGTTALFSPDLWLPLGAYELAINDFSNRMRMRLDERANHDLFLLGRLKPGLTRDQANASLALSASRLESAFPAVNRHQTYLAGPISRLSVSTSPQDESGIKAASLLLMSMAALVLMIACLNLASMQGARGASRRREIALRMALGSGRRRVVRQLLTEGLLLSLSGGVAGLALAWATPSLLLTSLRQMAPLTLVFNTTPDWRIIVVTLVFCFLSTLLFGLGPALRLTRTDLAEDLKEQQLTASLGGRGRLLSWRHFPVLAETALALTLLIAAGLFMRGALLAADTDPGFDLDAGLIAEVDASLTGMTPEQGRQLYLDLLGHLRSLPGAQSASLSATVPFGMTRLGQSVQPAGKAASSAQSSDADDLSVSAGFNIIGADYFDAIGLPLLRGRSFSEAEERSGEGTRVAIIDQALARRLWPDEEALGRWILFPSKDPSAASPEMEVVGIAANIQDSFFSSELAPHVYIPFGAQYQSNMHFQVKARRPDLEAVQALLSSVQKEIRSEAPSLPIVTLKSYRRHLEESLDLWVIRSGAQIFLVFGSLALFLAMVGVYGVRAYSVARRTREIGIRMALGSSRRETLWLVLGEGLKLTLAGSLLGLALALAVGQLIAGFLYNVEPTDAWVFVTAPLVLGAVSLLACYLPARRAARVDPVVALRCE